MQNCKDIVETPDLSFISAFSICMTVPLIDFFNPSYPIRCLWFSFLLITVAYSREEKGDTGF